MDIPMSNEKQDPPKYGIEIKLYEYADVEGTNLYHSFKVIDLKNLGKTIISIKSDLENYIQNHLFTGSIYGKKN